MSTTTTTHSGSVTGIKHHRINKDDAVLLIVDHQIGLFELVKDYGPVEFKNSVLAHAALGKVFGLPTVMTTSTEDGPNGPMLQEILDMYPPNSTPLIKRQGEVNAWDNEEFRKAVKDTGKKQVILAGIVTDVCTTFLALSLIQDGYEVFANSEASGTSTRRIADEANDRMRAAGVNVMSMFAVATDLMRDWRNSLDPRPPPSLFFPTEIFLRRKTSPSVAGSEALSRVKHLST